MWVDLLISTPITLFLLWLYWYSAPAVAPRWQQWVDTAVLLIAVLAVVLIIALGHLRIDYPGMELNVMLVATAYMALITLLGTGWLVRLLRARAERVDQ